MPHKDTETRRRYYREYKRLNKERRREMNADGDRKRHANRRAAAYGSPGILTLADVRAVMRERRCFYCGTDNPPDLGIDHIIPLHAGGPNTRENLVPCCNPCNASKWRSDAPRRWSRLYDECQGCGTTERRHCSKGLCNACYLRRAADKREALYGVRSTDSKAFRLASISHLR